jgi:GT2 family glycosyltransferase/tRNA A-37 threonylcarbamoyl transferase component Bud32
MDATVIVVNFNGLGFIDGCLGSIPGGVETIVVDNGSTDGSAEGIASRYPSVTLLRNPANRGFAAAVNQGLERARGRFLCTLNPDARLAPGALETLARHLAEHPDAGIVAPQLLHEDARRQHSYDNCPSLATVFLNKSLLRTLFPARYPSKRQEPAGPLDVESVIGACMMTRRDVVERIGPLDEAFFLFLEETDWCLRARQAGYRVVFVPEARVTHLQGRSREQVATRARMEYVRSLFTFFRKNRRGSYRALRLIHPVKNLLETLFLAVGTPFSGKVRRRWAETAALLGWQLAFCPPDWGLSTGGRATTLPGGWVVLPGQEGLPGELEAALPAARVIKDLRHKKTMVIGPAGRSYRVKVHKEGRGARRAAREFRACREAVRRGIPTVPVLAIRERADESWVVCEELTDWRQLQEVLLSEGTAPAVRRRLLYEYGRFARRLHDAGVRQYDFNPSNVLVRGTGLKVIDFERMELDRWLDEEGRVECLARMNRLPRLSRTDRLRFLKGYVDAHADERRDLGRIIARLAAASSRQADRDARKAARRCMEENRDFARFEAGGFRGYYLKRRLERGDTGLSPEEARALAERPESNGAWRTEAVDDALGTWADAHARGRRGGVVPVAVWFRRGERKGTVAWPIG